MRIDGLPSSALCPNTGRMYRKSGANVNRRYTGTLVFYEMLFVCFLLSIYTGVSLFISVPGFLNTPLFIPSFVTLVALLPIMLVLFWDTTYQYEASFIVQVFLVLLLTALISPGFSFINEKLLGLVQTTVSITVGVFLVKLIGRLDRRRAANILLVLAAIFVLGASLEVLEVLREASNAFRNVAYAQGDSETYSVYRVYEAVERDASITGFPRPNFFASEPSVLAAGFFAFVNSWLLTSYTKRNFFATCAMTAVMFVLTGSPVLVLSAMASTAIVFYSEKRLIRAVPVAAVVLIGFLATIIVSPEVFGNMIARFERVITIGFSNPYLLSNDSIGLRLVLPFVTLVDVLSSSPLFGVGISGKEVVELYSRFPLPPQVAVGNNNLAIFFTYLGVVGSTLFASTFARYLRRSGVQQITLLLMLIAALSLSMGGFESARFWGYVFLFVGAMKKRHEGAAKRLPEKDLDLSGRYNLRLRTGAR